jgi:hypothetical protein
MQDSPNRRNATQAVARVTDVCTAMVLLTYYWCVVRLRPRLVLTGGRVRNDQSGLPATGASLLYRIVSAVERASALHPLHPQCLEQALAARTMLTMRGERARVVIGVAQVHQQLAAHAWVQVGDVTNDAARPSYSELTQVS